GDGRAVGSRLFFCPRVSMSRVRHVRIPTGYRTEIERRGFLVTGRDAALVVLAAVRDGGLTGAAQAKVARFRHLSGGAFHRAARCATGGVSAVSALLFQPLTLGVRAS